MSENIEKNDTEDANALLNSKLRQIFDGKIVRKDLTKKIKEGANVPVYVLEFLLGQYCSSDDPDVIEAGVNNVKRILAENYVRPDEAQKILSVLRQRGSYTVIDKITVNLNIKKDSYEAELLNLQHLLFFDFLLDCSVQIMRSVRTHLIPQKHGLDHMAEDFFSRLAVLFIEGKKDTGQHQYHHQHCCCGDAKTGFGQEIYRNANHSGHSKTDELPLGQVEHDLRFDAVKILRDRYKCHCYPPSQKKYRIRPHCPKHPSLRETDGQKVQCVEDRP